MDKLNFEQILELKVGGVELRLILFFAIEIAFIILFTLLAVWLVKFLFRRSQRRHKKTGVDRSTSGFLERIVVYSIYIVGGAVCLSFIPGMEKVGTSLLAGAGIFAMAIGFASQEALSNIIGGLFIVFGKPFRIGDIIKVDSEALGIVKEITLRHTVIRSFENRMLIIPNSKVNSSIVVNSSISDSKTCAFVEVGVAYSSNLNQVIDIMRSEALKHPLLIDHRTKKEKDDKVEQVLVRVLELGDSAIILRAWAWAGNTADAFVLKCDLLKSIKERFDEEGVEIPFPCRNVYMRS